MVGCNGSVQRIRASEENKIFTQWGDFHGDTPQPGHKKNSSKVVNISTLEFFYWHFGDLFGDFLATLSPIFGDFVPYFGDLGFL